MTEITHRTVETNGVRMHIAEAGVGPLVLLCHGFPESWYSWRHQLEALAAAGFRAVAPDMRGYGRTDRPEEIEQYSLFHLVGDIVGLVDALGEEKAVVAGHDWGAPVAWHAALFRPDHFPRRLGLQCPVPTARVRESDERHAADERGAVLPAVLPGAWRRRGRARVRPAGDDPSMLGPHRSLRRARPTASLPRGVGMVLEKRRLSRPEGRRSGYPRG